MANMVLYLSDFNNKASFKFFVCSLISNEELKNTVKYARMGTVTLDFKPNTPTHGNIDYFLELSTADHTAYDKILSDEEFINYLSLNNKFDDDSTYKEF